MVPFFFKHQAAIRIFKHMEIMLISKDMFLTFEVARFCLEIDSVKTQQNGRTVGVISHNSTSSPSHLKQV